MGGSLEILIKRWGLSEFTLLHPFFHLVAPVRIVDWIFIVALEGTDFFEVLRYSLCCHFLRIESDTLDRI